YLRQTLNNRVDVRRRRTWVHHRHAEHAPRAERGRGDPSLAREIVPLSQITVELIERVLGPRTVADKPKAQNVRLGLMHRLEVGACADPFPENTSECAKVIVQLGEPLDSVAQQRDP